MAINQNTIAYKMNSQTGPPGRIGKESVTGPPGRDCK